MRMRISAKAFMLAMVVGSVAALSVAQTAPKPAFDIVSIKRQLPPITRNEFRIEPGRFVAEGFAVRYLLMTAYGVHSGDIVGAPDWVDSARYRIEAEADSTFPKDELPRMLQSVLVDRFQLKAHQETRELPAYELLVDRGGPKLKVSEDQTPAEPPPVTGDRLPPNAITPRGAFGFGAGSVNARAVPLSRLTDFLRLRLDRPVINKTGLTGLFDIRLQWAPGSEQVGPALDVIPQAPLNGPSLFTALQEQLGLRLRAARDPLDVVVIDSIQRPTEN